MTTVRVYVDSSVWNAAFNEHAPDLQVHSVEFFDLIVRGGRGLACVSDVVIGEIDSAPQARRLAMRGLLLRVAPTQLVIDEQSASLALEYVRHGVLTRGHMVDAQHVAIATVAGVDIVTSWNYRHLVNRRRREAFNGVNAIMGFPRIEIISPPEVFDV